MRPELSGGVLQQCEKAVSQTPHISVQQNGATHAYDSKWLQMSVALNCSGLINHRSAEDAHCTFSA